MFELLHSTPTIIIWYIQNLPRLLAFKLVKELFVLPFAAEGCGQHSPHKKVNHTITTKLK